jgi:SNF2 family DNA or RNA helicase
VITRARITKYKGLILADPPGLGKTLAALLAVMADHDEGDGPAVIVVPSSCAQQWVKEIHKNFIPVSQIKTSESTRTDDNKGLDESAPFGG